MVSIEEKEPPNKTLFFKETCMYVVLREARGMSEEGYFKREYTDPTFRLPISNGSFYKTFLNYHANKITFPFILSPLTFVFLL